VEIVSKRTVDWTGLRSPEPEDLGAAGLRDRKKRLTRQQLSDTATEMFLNCGFDAVRVVDVAEACGVSEKTVYNYFPTKESLILDRWDATMASLRNGLSNPALSPVQAALQILADELAGLITWLTAQTEPVAACTLFQRFGTMIRTTPALRAHQHDVTEQLIRLTAEILAGRTGTHPEDPEPQIAAIALIGLWSVQSESLRRNLNSAHVPAAIHQVVTDDVERAAHLIDSGLHSFGQAVRPE
jgi:AcrR family transcriptional regulator